MDGRDRRAHVRVEVDSVRSVRRVCEFAIEGGGSVVAAVRNIGQGGMCLAADVHGFSLKVGDRVSIAGCIFASTPGVLAGQSGTVTWVAGQSFGIRFDELLEMSEEALLAAATRAPE